MRRRNLLFFKDNSEPAPTYSAYSLSGGLNFRGPTDDDQVDIQDINGVSFPMQGTFLTFHKLGTSMPTTGLGGFLQTNTLASDNEFFIRYTYSNRGLEAFFLAQGGATFIRTTMTHPDDTDMHLLAITFDFNLTSGNFKMYFDGVLIDTTALPDTSKKPSVFTTLTKYGHERSDRHMKFVLGEGAFLNVVMTAQQISDLWNGGSPQDVLDVDFDSSDFIFRHKFDDASGSVAADEYGNYDGDLTNFPGDDSEWVSF